MTNKITASDIEAHHLETDSWTVVNGKVYDVTQFAKEHPGGAGLIYKYAGRDASKEYNRVHSPSLIAELEDSCLGELNAATVPPKWTEDDEPQQSTRPDVQMYRKPPLQNIINLSDFEDVAMHTLSPKSWAYNSGAANDNITRDANQTMFQHIWLRPAVMRDVSSVTTESALFGCKLEIPVYIAPVGAAKSVCSDGELSPARAANASGITQCIATTASYTLTEVLNETPENAFLQVYINKDRAKTESQIRQAAQSRKVKALFITADLPVMSKREADERILPEGEGLVVSINQGSREEGKGSAGLAKSNSSFIDPSLNWNDIAWLRGITDLPILVKGVQRVEDAQLAMRYGLDGIVISNHGGRAADTAPPSILTLLEIQRYCPEAAERMTILVDGGFRRGSDIVKAACLGASAVGLGRPFTYALCYGEAGIAHAVQVIKHEIETAMQLVGLTSLSQCHPRYLNTSYLDSLLSPNYGRSQPNAKL
ncbi:hypothetical protein ASPSYDRAFT_61049 [Aspergillus sydowii CBS 593.65]|uniref:Uncharacterized protein n=1 Tax=Aspergillus sydowii CBS 593.65 TaxID=1036612 RepID=A0A1L9T4U7_9EURO|nr:uncharacterized protein ASPSYDRAFT_61049 [Aspergillus sydowii CBS 593.65]OJJ54428.1 hypothetical protein ASPSYDRAFT_61049 [Aspergillus sydowii CBS 593.65]